MMAVWAYLCGPLNGISINYIPDSIGHTYRYTYYMMRGIMDHIEYTGEDTFGRMRDQLMCIHCPTYFKPTLGIWADVRRPPRRLPARGCGAS